MKLFDINRSFIEEQLQTHHVPGLSLCLLRPGLTVEAHCFGFADAEAESAVTPDTLFEAASLTKCPFAIIAGRLMDAGLLDPDRPLVQYYREKNYCTQPAFEKVSARHVLSHSAGLPNWSARPVTLSFAPGQGYQYSGEGYYYLQRTMEHLTGKTLQQLFENFIFEPAGMQHSTVQWQDALRAGFASRHNESGAVLPFREHPDCKGFAPEPNAAWSLYTTARDYALFLRFLLHDHAGLSDKTFALLTSPQSKADESILWGLGFGLIAAEPGLLWHWGDNKGYKNMMAADITSGCAAVLMSNGEDGLAAEMNILRRLTDIKHLSAVESFIVSAE